LSNSAQKNEILANLQLAFAQQEQPVRKRQHPRPCSLPILDASMEDEYFSSPAGFFIAF
jgi:hypothetical protein